MTYSLNPNSFYSNQKSSSKLNLQNQQLTARHALLGRDMNADKRRQMGQYKGNVDLIQELSRKRSHLLQLSKQITNATCNNSSHSSDSRDEFSKALIATASLEKRIDSIIKSAEKVQTALKELSKSLQQFSIDCLTDDDEESPPVNDFPEDAVIVSFGDSPSHSSPISEDTHTDSTLPPVLVSSSPCPLQTVPPRLLNQKSNSIKQPGKPSKLPTPKKSVSQNLKDKHTTESSADTHDQPQRQRRAALKVSSFTEPSLRSKLRKGDQFTYQI